MHGTESYDPIPVNAADLFKYNCLCVLLVFMEMGQHKKTVRESGLTLIIHPEPNLCIQ